MLNNIAGFLVLYILIGIPVAVLFDRSINMQGEWIWQTAARLRREYRRLYPKDKP